MMIYEEYALLRNRFFNPDRPCDECGAPPVTGESRQFAIVKLSPARLIYLICEACAQGDMPNISTKAEDIREHLVSERVAAIMCSTSSKETVQ